MNIKARINRVHHFSMYAVLCLLIGSAALAQDVTVSPASLSWASVQVGQTSGVKSFTLTNNQTVALTISSISIPAGSDFLISASSCPLTPSTLAAAGSCTISVQFRPLAQGSRTNAIKITEDAPSQTLTIPLSGNGTTGAVLFSPTTLAYTNVGVGTSSASQNATLTNTLATAITLTNIKISPNTFSQTNNCPASLAAGASCSVNVTYRPIAPGTTNGAVTATDNTGSVTASTQLYLSGSTTATTISPTSKDFGSEQVGVSSSAQVFTFTNNYSQAISITSVSTTLGDYSSSSNCSGTLAASASCTVSVTFAPTATGVRSDTLTISSNAPGSPTTAALTGVGTAAFSGVGFSPTSLSWGSIIIGQAAAAKSITLTNSTNAALTLSSIAVGSDYSVSSTTCPLSPSTLGAGANCTIGVSFHPLAQGLRSDMITVTDDGPASPQQVALSGTGVVGPALYSATSLQFPSTAVGSTSASQTATLTNEQATPLNIASLVASGNFAQTNTCPASLPAGASCTVTVGFTPAASGALTGSVVLDYGSGTLSLYLSGTGTTGGPSGSVAVSPKLFAFPAQSIGGSSSPANITLTNNQTTALTISSIQASAPFSQTNNCGTSLSPGKACTIAVAFSPTSAGYFSTNMTIADDAAGSPQTVALSGNGVVPVTTVPKVGGLYFYNQIVLTASTPLPVTLTNNQSGPLTIASLATSADYPYTTDCVDNSGSGTLAAGATCTVQITFLPRVIGSRPSALSITTNAPGGPLSVPLQGTGIAGSPGPMVHVSPYTPCALPSQTLQFSAVITDAPVAPVTWYVDNILNGNANAGTITASGLYTAPGVVSTHIIKAVTQGSTKISGTTVVTLTATPAFGIYPYVAVMPPAGQQTFQPQVCSAPDTQTVSFSVDNIVGGNATVGTITNNGVYTAPAAAGKHTVRVTDAALNKTSGAVVTVYSTIVADFGSRTSTVHPIPADMFGTGRGEAMHSTADRALLTQAGLTVSRLYAQIPLVYATKTPNWTRIDPLIASIQAAGQHPILQLSLTPPWLQPSPNPCGAGSDIVAPSDVNQWAQIAASYVAHMDATFPDFVQDYEIWNEPNATGLCATDHLKAYVAIYAAAAPAMKAQAAMDGKQIRVGGPVLSGYSALWLSTLLTNASTAPYVDFVSYHQYLFGQTGLQVQWDSYNGNVSLYEQTQDPSYGPAGVYNKVLAQVSAGAQPLGGKTPIYVTEFNTNWAFYKDCCRNDPTYAPLWNALYVTDLLNTAYTGTPTLPNKLIYFADSAYPWFCMVGVQNANMDCLYSAGSTAVPYPQYYTFQLLAGSNYLGLSSGGYMAKSVSPPTGGGGLAVTAFYNASLDAMVITNPTATAYSQMPLSFQNVGFASPNATLYQVVNGAMINSSSIALSASGSGFTTTLNIPAYSVQAISLKAQ